MKRIVKLFVFVVLILACVFPFTSCSSKQEKFEEAVILEIEQRIEEFTQGNPADNVKYEITIGQIKKYRSDVDVRVVYNIETTREPEIVAGKKFYLFYDYHVLFSSCNLESIEMSADLYGEVYVNGELKYTEKAPSSSNQGGSSITCQYKDSNGKRTCTREATRGSLCEYHFKMLDDTYNDFVN